MQLFIYAQSLLVKYSSNWLRSTCFGGNTRSNICTSGHPLFKFDFLRRKFGLVFLSYVTGHVSNRLRKNSGSYLIWGCIGVISWLWHLLKLMLSLLWCCTSPTCKSGPKIFNLSCKRAGNGISEYSALSQHHWSKCMLYNLRKPLNNGQIFVFADFLKARKKETNFFCVKLFHHFNSLAITTYHRSYLGCIY